MKIIPSTIATIIPMYMKNSKKKFKRNK